MTKIQKTMFIGKHFPKKTFITYLCSSRAAFLLMLGDGDRRNEK